CAREWFAYW
nr:immunoglobulin heavy chain junction region [Mus musculus]MBK4198370.1 immunoglobulin heavy chain junction region [Mus musculus]